MNDFKCKDEWDDLKQKYQDFKKEIEIQQAVIINSISNRRKKYDSIRNNKYLMAKSMEDYRMKSEINLSNQTMSKVSVNKIERILKGNIICLIEYCNMYRIQILKFKF